MIKSILKSVREYKKYAFLTPLFVALEVVMECIIPLVMKNMIDDMTGDSLTPIVKYGIILAIMAIVSLLFGVVSAHTAVKGSTGFAKNLRSDLYDRIQDFSFAEIDRFSSSSLVTRMTTDVTNVQQAYQMTTRIAIRTPLMLIFSFFMSFSISHKLAMIFLAILPVLGVILFYISFKVMPIFKRIFKRYDAMNNSVQENVAGIRVVKSFVKEEYEKEKFSDVSGEVCKDFTMVEKILALNNPTMMFCIYAAMVLISFFGAKAIIASGATELTTGALSSLITYGTQILSSMMMISMVFVMISMAEESARRIGEVLSTDSTLTSPENGVKTVPDGSVRFDNVSFRYSKKAKKDSLHSVNLTLKSGETLGIIGATGSSKTTLVQLIPRLYDATEGTVYVGGRDVREYDLESLRNAVAVVLQKNVLFSGTIKENLRWGDENASDEEIERVCRLAQADEFIQQFPQKYDTYIEQGGTNVSGGQKQRLCIARALLKKPKILILDDSTSAVDTRTDALIQAAFNSEIPDTTKIIIAQRVSSIEKADHIAVMSGGNITEYGTPAELYNAGGIYRELYDLQTKTKGDEDVEADD